jgi:hypothetical protein
MQHFAADELQQQQQQQANGVGQQAQEQQQAVPAADVDERDLVGGARLHAD